ncbi:other/FunK1 protein kinase [Coprinopsis cinerea okayama7|uniref:Other/FunK1 protein kinase n=1 Tax=Coprinopsis cinerea (strain Okayama-7 / 130 / ATCC MYA-4618 / FGSC 9003) TaxID=240176 RepID=A8NB82_COPC7|nr:other/FunK1 protein kinase [Coprinopsis cinerea okayama7\|eukprot:XP_001832081.1 other/FunK1 protein kinase [Coprinopsis cinerea okayama7\
MRPTTEPITPKRDPVAQAAPGAVSAPVGTTPRTGQDITNVDDTTTTLRIDIARLMNLEVVLCDADAFLNYYMPKCDADTAKYVLIRLATEKRQDGTTVLVPRQTSTVAADSEQTGEENAVSISADGEGYEEGPEDSATEDEMDDEQEATSIFRKKARVTLEEAELDDGEEEYPDEFEGEATENPKDRGDTGCVEDIYPYVLHDFKHRPSMVKKTYLVNKKKRVANLRKVDEDSLFSTLTGIGNAVRDALRARGVVVNDYHILMCPNTTLSSGIGGCDQRIDAALTKKKDVKGITVYDIIVPFEFKVDCKNSIIFENRRQVVSHVNHTMNDDPRRLFMYAISIEDDLVSVWYFSRSHSAKAACFSMVERPDILIKVFISLFCATDQQLGFDPYVTLVEDHRFVYELPPNEYRCKSLFYQTIESIINPRALRLRGRSTRVWKVEQVQSKKDHTRVAGTGEMILKDVSLSSDTATEFDIQNMMFNDMDKFASDPNWRKRDILKDCTPEQLEELAGVLEGRRFRELFSCVKEHHIGSSGLLVIPYSWRVPSVFMRPEKLSQPCNNVRTYAAVDSSSKPDEVLLSGDSSQVKDSIPEEEMIPTQALVPRRQCRLVFHHVYTPLLNIRTMGDAMDILKGQFIYPPTPALRVMFCAGWVHRDLSPGNILAARTSFNGPWQVKLSDLEYAKRFPSDYSPSATPKTASHHFIPYEVATKKLLTFESDNEDTILGSETEDLPAANDKCMAETGDSFPHTFQHDLESIWWIFVWLSTVRVDQRLPREKFVEAVFPPKLRFESLPHHGRWGLLTAERSLLKDTLLMKSLPQALSATNFITALDHLKKHLKLEYKRRNGRGKQRNPASYSWIINGPFRGFFRTIERSRRDWENIQLIEDPKPTRKIAKVKESSENPDAPPNPLTGHKRKLHQAVRFTKLFGGDSGDHRVVAPLPSRARGRKAPSGPLLQTSAEIKVHTGARKDVGDGDEAKQGRLKRARH